MTPALGLALVVWATPPPEPDPLAGCLARFPDAAQAGRGWAAADEFRLTALARRDAAAALGDWVGECQWGRALDDARHRAACWYALWQAAQSGQPALDCWRARNLAALEDLLGPADFALGLMPEPLPWRHFAVVP